jgi:hexosaminidase
MTPGSHCYLDHSQSANEDSLTIGGFIPLEKVYAYEPIPKELSAKEAKHILGAQGNVWTEYISNPAKVEYMIFPRMSALSEVLWSPTGNRNWKDFERRIPVLFKRYESWGANYSRAYYDLKGTVMPTDDHEGILWKLESKNKSGKILYTSPGNEKVVLEEYTAPVPININGGTYTAMNMNSSPLSQHFSINKATGKKITLANEPSQNYPGNGAFTLVDGVHNKMGLAKSAEFLGFLGKDMDAIIDLKTLTDIHKISLHVLDENGSWIYLPSQVEVTYLPDMDLTDDITSKAPRELRIIDPVKDKGTKTIVIENKQQCRYLHIVARNFGTIPSGNPGAGNPAWLFVDEIEVE